MKNKKLYEVIKIVLIILVVVLFILSFMVGKKIVDTEENIPIYSTIEEMPDVKTLINQMYGKFIKMEESKEEKYVNDIYVELKYPLYEGEESKKDFYNSLINTVCQKTNYKNVRILDEEKSIEIKIVCDSENKKIIGYYINGDTNFFGHYDSQINLAKYQKITPVNIEVQSNELLTLINNSWSLKMFDAGKSKEKVDNYIEYPNVGINIYDIDEKVFNLIFDSRYRENVINGIKVGDTFEQIINVLGTPVFGDKDDCYIGYKGEKMYVFFNKSEISVYPVETENLDLSKIISKYEADGSIKNMVSSTTDLWENYQKYYYDEYTVSLSYPLQGVQFKFGIDENHGITIYNNYSGIVFDKYTLVELSKLEIEIPTYLYFENKDYIDEIERERNIKILVMEDDSTSEEQDGWKYI